MLPSDLRTPTSSTEIDEIVIDRHERYGHYGRGAVTFTPRDSAVCAVEATRRSDLGPATVEIGLGTGPFPHGLLLLPETARAVAATVTAACDFADRSIPAERLTEILAALNRRPLAVANTWRSALHVFTEIDETETAAADCARLHDVLVLRDGTHIRYRYQTHKWEI